MLKIGVIGCGGRLGKEVSKALLLSSAYDLVAAITSPSGKLVGKNICDICEVDSTNQFIVSDDLLLCKNCDLLIDLTNRDSLINLNAIIYEQLKKPLIIGTTGLSALDFTKLENMSKDFPILVCSNFSLAFLNFLISVRTFAKTYAGDAVVIVETHHINKKDTPSGSATLLKDSIINSNQNLKVDIKSIRIGGIYGIHEVIFANTFGEEIVFSHRATSRDSYVDGIIQMIPILLTSANGMLTLEEMVYPILH